MDGGAIDDAPGACDGECSKALEAAEKGNSAVLHPDLLIREKCLSLLVAAVRKRKRTASNCFSLLAATLEEKDRAQCAADDISKDLLPPRKAATEGKTDSGHQTTRDGTTRAPHSQARKKIAGKSTILEGARHDLGPSLKGNEDRVGEAASAAKTNSDAKDTAMAQRHTGVCPKACCGECLTVEEVQQVLAALDSGDEAGLEAAACLLLGEEGHKGPAALTLKQPWARAILWKIKDVENRTYPLILPAHGGGKWLALHAGTCKHLLADAEVMAKVESISGISRDVWLSGIHQETGMLLGAMLITQVSYNQNNEQEACESVDQCEATHYHSLRHGCDAAGAEADKSPWCVDGQYGWRVHMVVPIQPIPIKGELGQWTLPPALRLLLALHIRCHLRCLPPCESMSPGSPPPEIAALNHGRRNGEAAQASDDVSCKMPAGRAHRLKAGAWEQLDVAIGRALARRKEQERMMQVRRVEKAARFSAARALLKAGARLEIVSSYLYAQENCQRHHAPAMPGADVRSALAGDPSREATTRKSPPRKGRHWVAAEVVAADTEKGGLWFLLRSLAQIGAGAGHGGAPTQTAASNHVWSVQLTCGAYERGWILQKASTDPVTDPLPVDMTNADAVASLKAWLLPGDRPAKWAKLFPVEAAVHQASMQALGALEQHLDTLVPRHDTDGRSGGPMTTAHDTWAQCDLCDKWRRLPSQLVIGTGDFTCASLPGTECADEEDFFDATAEMVCDAAARGHAESK